MLDAFQISRKVVGRLKPFLAVVKRPQNISLFAFYKVLMRLKTKFLLFTYLRNSLFLQFTVTNLRKLL